MPRIYDKKEFEAECTVTNGIARWNSNGVVPPQECLDGFAEAGCVFDMAACIRVREEEVSAFLAEYRKNARPPSSEQLAEMRAAFGPGVEVVNVITGRRTRT